jgi:hypothetical protein
MIELQSKILDAQSGMLAAQDERSALIERIRTLEEEVARLKAWEAEKQRYVLKDAGNGALAYALKEDARGPEPPHWICPQCYQDGKKSILQPETQIQGRCQVLACTRCNSELLIQGVRDLAVTRPKRRR